MKTEPEMTPEEFEKWLEQNAAAVKTKAERSAMNYLANQQANDLARKASFERIGEAATDVET